jgi:membrane-associated protein
MEWFAWLWDVIRNWDELVIGLADVHPHLFLLCFAFTLFAETGLIVTAFLPSETLVFAVSALSLRSDDINPWLLFPIAAAATALGDFVNMSIGRAWARRRGRSNPGWLFNERSIAWAERYDQRYGSWTVFLCRFLPLIRTAAPFVAGMGAMPYRTFLLFNGASAILWSAIYVGAGVGFAHIPGAGQHIAWITAFIAGIAFLPIIIQFWHRRRTMAREAANEG